MWEYIGVGFEQLLRHVMLSLYELEFAPRIQKFCPIKFPPHTLGGTLPINPMLALLTPAELAKCCGAGICWCIIVPPGANIGGGACMG